MDLTRRISWPCDVCALDGLKMVIHETTHRIAPLSVDRNMVGEELPILSSASGLAYISFAPKEEQDTLLAPACPVERSARRARARSRPGSRLIEATRRRGYAVRQAGEIWPHTGALALPVRVGRRVLGCINVVWMARVVSPKEGVSRYLEPLRETRQAYRAEACRGKEQINAAALSTQWTDRMRRSSF